MARPSVNPSQRQRLLNNDSRWSLKKASLGSSISVVIALLRQPSLSHRRVGGGRGAELPPASVGDRCGDSGELAELKIHLTSVASAGAPAHGLPPLTACLPTHPPTHQCIHPPIHPPHDYLWLSLSPTICLAVCVSDVSVV